MSLLLSIVTQVLHIVAVLAAAPLLAGLVGTLRGRLTGHAWPPVLRPWWEVMRLVRKQPIRAEGASVVTHWAPLVAVVIAALTALLIPTFALGTVSAPLTDLLSIVTLLALGRVLTVLAAMDAGTGEGGVGATETTFLAVMAEPAVLVGIFVVALLAGSGNLDTILSNRLEGLTPASPAAGLAIVGLGLLGWADRERPALDSAFSGVDLALVRVAEQLRLLAWCDLIGALALPAGMAAMDSGPWAWGIGLLAWAGRLGIAAAIFAAAPTVGAAFRVRTVLVLALVLCGVAVVLGFTGGDPT